MATTRKKRKAYKSARNAYKDTILMGKYQRRWEFLGFADPANLINPSVLYRKVLKPKSASDLSCKYQLVIAADDYTDVAFDVLDVPCFLFSERCGALKLIRVFEGGMRRRDLPKGYRVFVQSSTGVLLDLQDPLHSTVKTPGDTTVTTP